MSNLLTYQDCFKYPESRLIYPISKVEHKNIESFFNAKLVYPQYTYCISDCKIILRDISQLMDDEKEYMKKYFGNRMVGMKVFDWKEVCGDFGLSYLMGFIQTRYIVELVDYLRRKGVMVEREDWFKIGKAVRL